MTEQEGTTDQPAGENPRQATIINAQFAFIAARFGDGLSAEERAEIRSRLARSVALGEQLRSVPLANSDEPEMLFIPYRGKDDQTS